MPYPGSMHSKILYNRLSLKWKSPFTSRYGETHRPQYHRHSNARPSSSSSRVSKKLTTDLRQTLDLDRYPPPSQNYYISNFSWPLRGLPTDPDHVFLGVGFEEATDSPTRPSNT
ncbi:hypothetical protein BDQ12DRAFT_692476 [Crucibulum laeve]|uniref:Uncharacterized protein n=1 Tax=Crucibulum laeve TaxID=68775 RepID=A0A5C3LHZ5_9AGAR|nr:hypothetical protein BDQ12DRAFT_692476 [Crucibulum laeve]